MREQHLSQCIIAAFFSVVQFQGNIPQGKPHQVTAPFFLYFQRNKCWQRWHNCMPCLLCQRIAVPRRPRCRIGCPTSCQQHTICSILLAGGSLYASTAAFLQEQLLHGFPINGNPCPFQGTLQRCNNIFCSVTHRKYSIAPFHFQRNTQLFKICHYIFRHPASKRTVQELWISRHICHERIQITGIGEVAATFSGNPQFSSDLPIFF